MGLGLSNPEARSCLSLQSGLKSPSNRGLLQSRRFCLNKASWLIITEGDISKWSGEALVNCANPPLMGSHQLKNWWRFAGRRNVDAALHEAAGPALLQACLALPEVQPNVRCPVGEVRLTPGFRLHAEHVLHTVGPSYKDASASEAEDALRATYRNCLAFANGRGMRCIAFPAISCGVGNFPQRMGALVAVKACVEHVGELQVIELVALEHSMWQAFLDAAGHFNLQAADELDNGSD